MKSPKIFNSLLLASLAVAIPLSNGNTDRDLSGSSIIDQALSALGGATALSQLKGITYHAPSIYRSRSLMQGYSMNKADTPIAITGGQDISFDYTHDSLRQRIDRNFIPSDYWSWAIPRLDPFNYTLVVQGGNNGFACYTRGNNQLWLPNNISSGYTDSALAEYFVLHGQMLSPKLLIEMQERNTTSVTEVAVNGISMPAVSDTTMDITVIFNPATFLPYIVRTTELHPIYGASFNDLVFNNYTTAAESSLLFPHHVQTVYNATTSLLNSPLEDFIIESVEINPAFSVDFFDGLPQDQSMSPKSAPHKVDGVTHAHLTEYSSNMLWSGLDNTTVQDLKVSAPVNGLPNVYWMVLKDDFLGVKQMIIEFDKEVIVGDAPPNWSKLVLKWIKENINKPVTYLFPTHHHRDHTGGAPDYVAGGAKLIVPEAAAEYWSNIPGAELVTFNETHPYVHNDSKIQAWFNWQHQATHSVDFAYSFVTPMCPEPQSPAIIFEADVWHGGLPVENNDIVEMWAFLDELRLDGVTRNATIYPTHGQISPLIDLIEQSGYTYPELRTTDWRNGATLC